MKTKVRLTKKDCIVILCCAVFGLMCMGAIGGGSRKHAKDIVCRANLRKLYLAMIEFTNDNNGNLWKGFDPSSMSESEWWMAALHDYYGEIDNIRLCPTATEVEWDMDGKPGPGEGKEPFRAWGFYPLLGAENHGSYGANGWIEDKPDHVTTPATKPKYWRNINKIAEADTVPFMLDAQWLDGWPESWNYPPDNENTNWQQNDYSHMVRFVQNRHEEAENCAFMDGTVRKVGLKELWTLKWHRLYNTEGMWTLAGGATPAQWPEWMRDMEDY